MAEAAPAPAHPPVRGPAGLWPSEWPAEDGGPARRQAPHRRGGLGFGAGERLTVAARRGAFATTMLVLREPGELFALRHTLGPLPRHSPTVAWVERLNPASLAVLARSPRLPAGPFWPGGLAAHANGSLHVVYGRFAHRLSPGLELLNSSQLPAPRPHNSFVVLSDGTLATKDLDLTLRAPATISLLDPETLLPRAAPVKVPESVIARLSADGELLYVIGASTVWRYRWDGERLTRDEDWQVAYHGGRGHGYGWDGVLAGGQLWFLDNGQHAYTTTMRGAARCAAPVRLLRVSLSDAGDREAVEVCGLPRGAVTDPPLYDERRRIAIAYDSANGVVQAFRFRAALEPLWRRDLNHAAHMLHFPDTGELVVHDFHGPAFARTRAGRILGRAAAPLVRSARAREALSRGSGDAVVVLDIETGEERARARVPSLFQSVLFPAPGFGRDLYWCTFSTIARLAVVI